MEGEIMSMNATLSRRAFAVGAGAAALGTIAALGAGSAEATAAANPVPAAWDMEADVVVVGAGGAGMAAACTAREAGSSVLVLEKLGATGGDTGLSGQCMLGPWPEGQKEVGVEDTIEAYMADMANSYRWGAFAEQGREMPAEHPFTQLQCDLTPDMMTWTRDVVGVGWNPSGTAEDPVSEGVLPQPTWDTVTARTWMAMDPSSSVMAAFNAHAAEIGVDVRLRTVADRLIVNEDGRVVGLYAYDENDQPIAVKAAQAVILATGAFCSDRGMMERYLPITKGIQGGGSYGVTGDGIRMARQIGASASELDLGCHWYPYEAGTNSGQFSTTLIMFGGLEGQVPISQQPGVLLNYNGERFVSESNGYHLMGRAIAQQPCQEAWYVFDSHPMVADLILNAIPYNNRAVKADTLEELYTITRLPADAAQASIDAYNGYVAVGADEECGKLLDGCQPIDQGPFYAINVRPRPYATYGGLDTDLDARVLTTEGAVIPGLYAAGIVTGSWAAREGFYYNGGLAQALVFGRLAGKNAAADEAWEAAAPTGLESAEQFVMPTGICSDCHGDDRAVNTPNYHNFG